MPKGTDLKIELVGPREGQTVELHGVQFDKGSAVVNSTNETLIAMLASYHNAHVVGSDSHAEAVEKWEASKPKPVKTEPATPPVDPNAGKTKK